VSDPINQAGMRVRREVLGNEHVDRAVAATTAFTQPFQEFITSYDVILPPCPRVPGPPFAQIMSAAC
jgi:hypothetical protein